MCVLFAVTKFVALLYDNLVNLIGMVEFAISRAFKWYIILQIWFDIKRNDLEKGKNCYFELERYLKRDPLVASNLSSALLSVFTFVSTFSPRKCSVHTTFCLNFYY